MCSSPGSPKVGRLIMELAAKHLVPVTLESQGLDLDVFVANQNSDLNGLFRNDGACARLSTNPSDAPIKLKPRIDWTR